MSGGQLPTRNQYLAWLFFTLLMMVFICLGIYAVYTLF